MPKTKYQCFVLWRNRFIPKMAPAEPPMMAERKRVFSGILHRWCCALYFTNTHQCKCQYIDSNQIIVKHYEILLLVSVISLSYSILGKKSK